MSDPNTMPWRGLQAAVDETSLWLVFAVMGGSGASMLALGMLLRSNQALSKRVVIGTLIHSAAWGSAVYLMSYSRFSADLPFLLGLSIFSGMGAASFIDLALLLVKQRLGISVTFNKSEPPAADQEERQPDGQQDQARR
jgi:pimeloyl-ACP methyl ester carboxylesterase